jgi:hypothetical protein
MRQAARHIAISPTEPTFIEGWGTGTYLVTGVFPPAETQPEADGRGPATEGEDLTMERIERDAVELLERAKRQKKTIWPWFMCSAYVFPIYYSVEGFEPDLLRKLRAHSQHWKYGAYLDPILIDGSGANAVWLRDGFENKRFMMWRHVINVALSATLSVAKHKGLTGKLSLNDGTIYLEVPTEKPRASR